MIDQETIDEVGRVEDEVYAEYLKEKAETPKKETLCDHDEEVVCSDCPY